MDPLEHHDPEALDAAVRLAGTIRWFDDGTHTNPPYDVIASVFEGCFDPAGKLYPGSRDRAYYSGRAMVWIHALAKHKSWEFSHSFPLSCGKYEVSGLDPDLRHLLHINRRGVFDKIDVVELLGIDREHTPSHAQWISDVLLQYPGAVRSVGIGWCGLGAFPDIHQTKITINMTLNRLLTWCIVLGPPPAGEALRIQNKSYDNSYFTLLITHSVLR